MRASWPRSRVRSRLHGPASGRAATGGTVSSSATECPSTASPRNWSRSRSTRRPQAVFSSRCRATASRSWRRSSRTAACMSAGSARSRRGRALSSPELSVASSRVERLRAIAVTPQLFVWAAAASALSLYLILITGATVRLTASGLGCEHWPGCQAGQPFPEKGYHSYIEFGNRLVGGVTIALTLVAALGAFRTRGLPRWARRLALAVFVGALAQAPLGYFTVRFHLNPYLVISHFLLSAVVLAGAVLVLLSALGLRFGETNPLVPRELQHVMTVAAAAALVLLVSGTIATAS